jgi:predicted DNA-binding transcriptional regulator AlpA
MKRESTIVATSTGWEPMFTYRDLEDLTRLSSRTIIRLVALGLFPRPVKIGHSCRWRRQDVAEFLEREAKGGTGAAGTVGGEVTKEAEESVKK